MNNTSRIGAAATHLVCASLLLEGYNAFLAPEGCHYDVVVDLGVRLLRVQVKASSKATARPNRPAIVGYQFTSSRNHRPEKVGGKSIIKRYKPEIVDVIAFVGLDIKAVAYFAVTNEFVHAMWLYPPGTPTFMRGKKEQRRCIDQFPFKAALAAHTGKPTLGWI